MTVARESTFTNSWVLPVQSGNGYLVTMQGGFQLNSRLELTAAAAPAGTLLAASRIEGDGRSQLVFTSTSTSTDTVRATVGDPGTCANAAWTRRPSPLSTPTTCSGPS